MNLKIIDIERDKDFPEETITRLREAKSCVVLTGAGVSAESGVPTFRDALTGTWSNFNVEEFATPEAFRKNPKKVWEWYEYRRNLLKDINPNEGHYAIAELERIYSDFWLVTQNIDGLHHKAGNKNVLEIHGNICRNKCFEENTIVDNISVGEEIPPRCPDCGSYVRPDVVWFHEPLPKYEMEKAIEVSSRCDIFIVAGTSAIVYPAAELPIIAKNAGAYVMEINIEETLISTQIDMTILGKTGIVLPKLIESIMTKEFPIR